MGAVEMIKKTQRICFKYDRASHAWMTAGRVLIQFCSGKIASFANTSSGYKELAIADTEHSQLVWIAKVGDLDIFWSSERRLIALDSRLIEAGRSKKITTDQGAPPIAVTQLGGVVILDWMDRVEAWVLSVVGGIIRIEVLWKRTSSVWGGRVKKTAHDRAVYSAILGTDGLVAVCMDSGVVKLIDVNSGQLVSEVPQWNPSVSHVGVLLRRNRVYALLSPTELWCSDVNDQWFRFSGGIVIELNQIVPSLSFFDVYAELRPERILIGSRVRGLLIIDGSGRELWFDETVSVVGAGIDKHGNVVCVDESGLTLIS